MRKSIKVKCCRCNHEWEFPVVVVGYVKAFYLTTASNNESVDKET